MLAECKKAAIIHPTGTGKSFIAFKLCEDNPDKCICWVSPSEYIFKTQLENLEKVSGGYVPDNIAFFTYAKLMNMSDEEIKAICPSYIIFDEFHRCGAEMWGQGVSALLSTYPSTPILGLSATAIRYLDNQRDMADELFDGNVASEMTLGEAIVKGILNPPKYVLSVFSYQKDLEKYEKRVRATRSKVVRDSAEKYLDALRRALEKAEGLDVVFNKHISEKNGKYIVFCANYEHMREMIEMAPEWFSRIDEKPHIYSAYSNDPETSQAFADFKSDKSNHLKLLFCIDMLNEGIHVDDISGVILLRPTVSPIIYKQQIGRALSANKKKHAVIFDIVLNIENLYSIGAIEDEIQVTTAYYRSLGLDNEIVNEHFTVVDEVKDCIALFDKLNDTLTASWGLMYKHAQDFYKENGHLEMSSRYRTADGYSLGKWIFVQRSIRLGQAEGKLTLEQIAKLDAIGMVWETVSDQNWTRYYEAAKRYFVEKGNLDVEARYVTEDHIPLGQWLANLRIQEKAGARSRYLTEERKEMLNALGMIWSKLDYYWERNFAAAVEYFKENGHLNVPTTYVSSDGIRLGTWISNIRTLNAGKKMRGTRPTKEQIARFNAIGMVWSNNVENKWEKGFSEAREYAIKHKTLIMSNTYVSPSGYNLGVWLVRQNKMLKEGKLSSERKQRLDCLGVEWIHKDPWLFRYDLVIKYYEENQTIDIPQAVVVEGVWIGKWIITQKKMYEQGCLSKKQMELIDKLPMEQVGRKNKAWYAAYDDILSFYKVNGNINIPSDVMGEKTGINLSDWIIRQRSAFNLGKLSKEQIALLNKVEFVWVLETTWEKGYRHAKDYYIANGNLSMNQSYKCPDGYALGIWVFNYRKAYNGQKTLIEITPEQIVALEAIGMDWERPVKLVAQKITAWDKNCEKLVQFFKTHGRYPQYNTDDIAERKLFSWLQNQRKMYRDGYYTREKLEKLSVIGITEEWLCEQLTPFDKGFLIAKAHYEECGSLNVPTNFQHKSGFWLGSWIDKIRKKKSSLTPEQIQRLESIGFVWEIKDPFEEGFATAESFYVKNGYLPLEPKQCNNEDDLKICRWLRRQLIKQRNNELSNEQFERLTAIGMDWMNSIERAWDRGYSRAKAYYETNGDLNVIVSYVCPDGYPLGEWLHTQRKHRSRLTEEKLNMLIAIGAKGIERRTV